MKITIVGAGHVGLAYATLLSQKYEVVALDINKEVVTKINKRICPISDKYIEQYFKEKKLNLKSTNDYKLAFKDAKYIIICTPTNYDEINSSFDTSLVEEIIKKIKNMKINTTIIIKSTIPIGFIDNMKEKYKINNLIFSPEFLREGMGLYDNLYPSRIIIGEKSKRAEEFANILKDVALKKDITIKFMNPTEAEAVKLFSNAYLALRIAYFNELDTFAELKGLNTKDIIEGVCLDPRIGFFYNNPSFGYGGYCLPKDTKQLLTNFETIPQNLFKAIVNSNDTRKKHIVDMVLAKKPKTVGVYRLTSKKNIDNFKDSAVQNIMKLIADNNVKIIIYEPMLEEKTYLEYKVVNNLYEFKKLSDIIIANRLANEILDVRKKVYTRDIYNIN